MTVYLSAPQLAIVRRAKRYFDNTMANIEVRSLFRAEGPDMGVGLAYSEAGHHFIVRVTIPRTATDNDTAAQCARLFARMSISYRSVMKRRSTWNGDVKV